MKSPLLFILLLPFILCTKSCTGKSGNNKPFVLVGSTPGDELIKSLLLIDGKKQVDFIKWNLTLTPGNAGRGKFDLAIVYGVSKPNTNGFENNGEKRSLHGEYRITENKQQVNGMIYHLKTSKISPEILMVKLNNNLFHLLTPQLDLMVGNGGWSYTLNRAQPENILAADLPSLKLVRDLSADTSKQIIFEGRTPCKELAKEYNMGVAADCFKLKWKLILNKDPVTLEPTTYYIQRTGSREQDITGKWTITRGTSTNGEAIIYQLDPGKQDQSLSFLLGDKNVLFFLNKNNQLYVGNNDFSFTLNKRRS